MPRTGCKSGELRAVVATASLELGHRHRLDRSRRPARLAALDRGRAAARRPLGPLDRREARRAAVPRDARRAARMRGARPLRCAAARWTRLKHPERAARHSRAAARRGVRHRRMGSGRAVRDGARRLSVSRSPARGFRRRRRDAGRRRRNVARAQRSVPPLRSRQRRVARAARRAASPRSPRGGAIPETANYNVVAEPEGHVVGTRRRRFRGREHGRRHLPVGDELVEDPARRDRRRARRGRARRAADRSRFGTAKGSGRTVELSHEVAAVRAAIDERDDAAARRVADRECGLDEAGASRPSRTFAPGRRCSGPSRPQRTLVAERFFDEGGRHAAGAAHAVRRAHQSRVGLGAAQEVLPLVQSRTAGGGDRQRHRALADRPARLSARDRLRVREIGERRSNADAGAADRADVRRALALERDPRARDPAHARRAKGRAAAAAHARRRSARGVLSRSAACAENLSGPMRIPDHVLVRETIDNCLHEAMDLDGLLDDPRRHRERRDPHGRRRHAGALGVLPRDPQRQSVRIPRRCAARRAPHARRQLRRTTRGESGGAGILDPAAIAEVAERSWPLVRDADELHDALATLVVLPPVDAWQAWFEELTQQRRATALRVATALGAEGASSGPAPSGSIWRASPIPPHSHFRRSLQSSRLAVAGIARGGVRRDRARLARIERPRDGRGTGRALRRRSSRRHERADCARSEGQVLARPVSRRGRGVVQPARAGAHPPPDDRHAAARDRAGQRRRNTCAFCIAGSTSRRSSRLHGDRRHAARRFGNSKATRFRPPRGKRTCCPRASPATSPSISTSCATPVT